MQSLNQQIAALENQLQGLKGDWSLARQQDRPEIMRRELDILSELEILLG